MQLEHSGSEQSSLAKDAAPRSELAPRAGGNRLSAFRALRHRNFRLFFTGQLVSLVGTWMQMVAQSWLVFRLTKSSMMLGVVSFAGFMPTLAVALFAGVVVDHADRRRLIMLAQSLMMVFAFLLAFLTWSHVVRVEHVIILAALNGLVSSFDIPGRQAFLSDMVGREDLPNAIALNSMIFNAARTVGPAIAGILLVVVGEAGCFFVNGLSYLAVLWSLFAMDVRPRMAERFGRAIFKRLREGLSYAWRHHPTFHLLMLMTLTSGFGMQFTVLLPVFAADVLHGGPRAYGFLLAAQGIGAVLGAIAVARRPSAHKTLRENLIWGLFSGAISILVFAASPVMALSLAAQMVNGFGLLAYMATTNTMLQLFVSDELRGRVMSLYTMSFIGMAPLGSLEVGYVGQHVSPRVAVTICGLVYLMCAFYLLSRLKLFKDAERAGALGAPSAA